jgi:hypothetical protein
VVKYQNVNDHYDAMSIWRTICSKWLSTVHLLSPEGYPINLVLAICKYGEPFMMMVCTPLMCKLSRLYIQLFTLHVQSFAAGFWKTSSSTQKVY